MKSSLVILAVFLLMPLQLVARASADSVLSKVIDRSIKNCERKYNLRCSGKGLSMPGGPIRSIGFSFDASGPMPKNEIRKIIIGCVDELIAQARNSDIDQFLYQPPFGLEQVQINVFLKDKKDRIYHPDIRVAGILEGILDYNTYDPNEKYPREVEITKETYEEAVALLEQETNIKCSEVLSESEKHLVPTTCKRETRRAQRKHRYVGHTL